MRKVSLQCRNVSMSYGATEVLKGIDLDVVPGEFFALLGPSGSGKSTLLRLIAGFARQQQGRLLVDGVDIGGQPPWLRNIGMVFQSYALWPHLSVWDNVAFGLVERRVARDELRRRVGDALELVGLAAHAQRRPSQLSGGQQQRVALARTIVIEPQLLLLDEPLSNLDKTLRVQMRQELQSLQRRLGITTLFVTHDQEEAMGTADRMAVLDQGVLQQVGTPATLYDEPVNGFVAGFVGTMNLLPAQLTARRPECIELAVAGLGTLVVALPRQSPQQSPRQSPPLATGSAVLLSLRPHLLGLLPADAVRDPGSAWFDGLVEASEFLGPFTRYRVRVGGHALAVDLPHRAGQGGFAPGSAVALGVDPALSRLLPA